MLMYKGNLFIESPKNQHDCVICGKPCKERARQTCGDVWCMAELDLEPGKRHPDKVKKHSTVRRKPQNKKTQRWREKMVEEVTMMDAETFQKSASTFEERIPKETHEKACSRWSERSKDERLSAVCEGVKTSPWSRRTTLNCFLKAVGGKPALTIAKKSGQSLRDALKNVLFVDENSQFFDYFYAWKCGCVRAHEVNYRRIENLPCEVGYHNLCEVCGSAPLEIVIAEKERVFGRALR